MGTICLMKEIKAIPEEIFRKHGGQLRMSEALKSGITRYMLYSLQEKGIINRISRGIYRLADLPQINNPDLVTVSLRFPNTVICLISALSYHDMTTQIPHRVSIAFQRDSRMPSLDYPPIKAYKFSSNVFNSGIEKHKIDGVPVKIYNPEKTLTDCFKFRNKIGLDVVLEALKFYKTRKKPHLKKLFEYARICKVENVIRPYLEATL